MEWSGEREREREKERKREEVEGVLKTDTSQAANPKEFYSISLESFCFKVKSVTKESNPNSNSSKRCSVPIYGPNPGSERQERKERDTHIRTHTRTHTHTR